MEILISGKIQRPDDRHNARVSKQTGFPSAATHYLEHSIDLNQELTPNTDATFYVRINGETWNDFSIFDRDVLIIDRSLKVSVNDLALVVVEGEFKVLRIVFGQQEEYILWGVITYIIHAAR